MRACACGPVPDSYCFIAPAGCCRRQCSISMQHILISQINSPFLLAKLTKAKALFLAQNLPWPGFIGAKKQH